MNQNVKQRTIRRAVEIQGNGLHSGSPVRVKLLPAIANSGILFDRVDMGKTKPIPAHYQNVINTRLATTLAYRGVAISTVEHLLAAIRGADIDNIRIEVDGPEIPIMDGSAKAFYDAICDAGFTEQNFVRPTIRIKKKIEYEVADGKWAIIEPSKNFEVRASFDWSHPMMKDQNTSYRHEYGAFNELASARTFCFLKDVEMMKQLGLAKGGSLDNAIVLTQDGVANSEGLRYSDEFGRHKVLDALGDFRLAGLSFSGKFTIHKSGHTFNRMILKKLFEDLSYVEVVDGPAQNLPAKQLYYYLKSFRVAAG